MTKQLLEKKGFMQTDRESLFPWDRKLNLEIYAEYLCINPVHDEQTLGPRDDFFAAINELDFPDHGVIFHPEKSPTAYHNPTGRKSISKAGRVLLKRVTSLCPSYSYPGFARGVPGLAYSSCGLARQIPKAVVFECVQCTCSRERPRSDTVTSIDPSECEICTP